ncbi:ankyrin repeat domain-containing protein [Thalassobacillus hwangdonensis]|uniref:Ankyrin repeat domain-containing protein n=1 Tax=Thalassobacillus hwangdonensis TaxID=546108 RepID=A0ABW3L204_9BACI
MKLQSITALIFTGLLMGCADASGITSSDSGIAATDLQPVSVSDLSDEEILNIYEQGREGEYNDYGDFVEESVRMIEFSMEELLRVAPAVKEGAANDATIDHYETALRTVRHHIKQGVEKEDIPALLREAHLVYVDYLHGMEKVMQTIEEDDVNQSEVWQGIYIDAKREFTLVEDAFDQMESEFFARVNLLLEDKRHTQGDTEENVEESYVGDESTEEMQVEAVEELDLFVLVNNGDGEGVRKALEQGENPNINQVSGETPLELTARHGHVDMMQALLNHGADPNKSNNQVAATPLEEAIWNREDAKTVVSILQMVELLLDYGADVNHINDNSDIEGKVSTALMTAVQFNYEPVIELLLEHEADPYMVVNGGRSAYSIAEERGYSNVLDLMKKYAGNPPQKKVETDKNSDVREVPDFNFPNQDGGSISNDALFGETWMGVLIDTKHNATTNIPLLVKMKQVQHQLASSYLAPTIVAFTVRPEYDSSDRLKEFKQSIGFESEDIHFVSPDSHEVIRTFAREAFQSPMTEDGDRYIYSYSIIYVNGNGVIVDKFPGQLDIDKIVEGIKKHH